MKKIKMTGTEIANRAIQIFLLFLEIGIATIGLTAVSVWLFPCESGWPMIERALLCYSIYQVLVFLVLSTLNDIQQDSCLAMLTMFKRLRLYTETCDSDLKVKISETLDWNLEPGTLNDMKYREVYAEIKCKLEEGTLDACYIEQQIIKWEHFYTFCSLQWRFSFLLRIFK